MDFSCCAKDKTHCGHCDDGDTKTYVFRWCVEYSDPARADIPGWFYPFKTFVPVSLCDKHYKMALEHNNGERPVLYGPTEDDALAMLTYEYIPSILFDKPNDDTKCIGCGERYGGCGGSTRQVCFPWKYKDRMKYGGESYFTVLRVNVCEHHHKKIIEKSENNLPLCYGWDEWDALDSISVLIENQDSQKIEITRTEKPLQKCSNKPVLRDFIWDGGKGVMVFDASKNSYTIEEFLENGEKKSTIIG